jgi:hypothetical protein
MEFFTCSFPYLIVGILMGTRSLSEIQSKDDAFNKRWPGY